MFTDLLTLFQLVGDLKLASPLGLSLDEPKPKLAESWRSGRSLRNVELNLESARAMYGKDGTSGFRSLMPAGGDSDDLDDQIARLSLRCRHRWPRFPCPWTLPSAIPARDRKWRRCWPTSGASATWWASSCRRRSAFPWEFNALDGD